MRGFLSGAFWGLALCAVVLVAVSLRLGDPVAVEAEIGEAEVGATPAEVILTPEAEPDAPASAVIVTTDPEADPEPDPSPRDGAGGGAVGADPSAADAPDASTGATMPPGGDDGTTTTIERTVPVEPVEDADEAPADGG